MQTTDLPRYQAQLLLPRYWLAWLGLGLMLLLARLPYRLGMRVGASLGALAFRLIKARRRIAEINIDLCFPELSATERRELTRKNGRDTGMGLLETVYGLWGNIDGYRGSTRFHGLPALLAAQAEGKGVILVGLHLNCVDIAGRLLSEHVTVDYQHRPNGNPVIETALTRARRCYMGDNIERTATRHLLRNLRAGHIVWYAPDQDHGISHGVFAPFFGIPAATITAVNRISRLNQSPVVFIRYYRRDDLSGYDIYFDRAGHFPTGNDVADASTLNHFFEQAIREKPEHYMWVHRKFKTRPQGLPELYQRGDGQRYGD